jgi:multicomponent Na+:H+ antiporter subunit F
VTGYEIETLALLVGGIAPVAALGCLGRVEERLVALQLVSAVSVLVLLLVAVAVGQPSMLIVPLTLPALAAAGTLVYTRMLAPQGESGGESRARGGQRGQGGQDRQPAEQSDQGGRGGQGDERSEAA